MEGETRFETDRCNTLMNNTDELADDDREHLLARAKIAFAGSAGEAIGCGGAHPLGPESDHKQAWAILKRIGPNRPNAQELNLEVQQLVIDNEAALHRIANALLADGTLTPERVKQLIIAP